jgi:uncharacterized protein
MPPFANHKPLTDTEIDRLGEFLARKADSGMNIETLDGFFVALVCGPEAVMPSEYVSEIWESEPPFESIQEAQECFDLMTRHWNTIAGTLYRGDVYFPVLLEEGGIARGNDWAKGFVQGMDLRHDAWGVLVSDDEHGGCLVPILALYHEHDPDPKLRPKPFTPKQREKLLADLIAGIVLIYRYFRKGSATRWAS